MRLPAILWQDALHGGVVVEAAQEPWHPDDCLWQDSATLQVPEATAHSEWRTGVSSLPRQNFEAARDCHSCV